MKQSENISRYMHAYIYIDTHEYIVTFWGYVTNNCGVPDHFNRFIEHTEVVITI
jgi:hypothetical protein